MKAKISKTTFKSCGLNAKMNFLQAQLCPCGCGHYCNLVLKTNQDLYDFIGTMLEEHDCNHCAIFALRKDGSVTMGVKLDGDIKIYGTSKGDKPCDAREFIKEVQRDFEFHCYGLLRQVNDTEYEIIMD